MGGNQHVNIREIVVEASVDALNAAIEDHDIDAEKIIAIQQVPPTGLGGMPASAKFRVFYIERDYRQRR